MFHLKIQNCEFVKKFQFLIVEQNHEIIISSLNSFNLTFVLTSLIVTITRRRRIHHIIKPR